MKYLVKLSVLMALGALAAAATPATKPGTSKLKADAPEAVKKLWNSQAALRKEEGQRLDEERKKIQKELTSAAGPKRKQLLENLKKNAEAKKSVATKFFIGKLTTMKPGDIGTIRQAGVQQVIDAKNVRIRVTLQSGGSVILQDATGSRVQRIDPTQQDAWLTDFDTTGLVDDTALDRPLTVMVVGTRQYGTAIGTTKTVPELKPFDISDYLE